MTIWDKPKQARKKYHEMTEAQKRAYDRYADLMRKKSELASEQKRKKSRLKKLNTNAYRTGKRAYHDQVAVIHWVKDTPKTLAAQFLEWRTSREQR